MEERQDEEVMKPPRLLSGTVGAELGSYTNCAGRWGPFFDSSSGISFDILVEPFILKDSDGFNGHTIASANRVYVNTLLHTFDTDSRRRLVAAMLLVSTVIVFGMLAPIPSFGRLTVAIGDLMHAPLFGSMTLLTLLLLDHAHPRQRAGIILLRMIVVITLVFGFGLLMEFNQLMVGRHAALHDVVANGLGIVAASLWYGARTLVRQRDHHRPIAGVMLAGAGLLLIIASWQPMMLLARAFERFI